MINTKEKQELLDLTIYAFHKPRTPERERAFAKLLEFSTAYSHRDNEALTSMVIDTHFDVYWKKKTLKMSGVGYVASYPEFRGNGAIRGLMTQLLQENYAAGTALSYLAPFSYSFYEKFGYAYAFNQKSYQIPAQAFPKGRRATGEILRTSVSECNNKIKSLTELSVGHFSENLLQILSGIHQKTANQGSLVRPAHVWDYFFINKSQPNFAIYQQNGEALGYLIYEFSDMSFVIRELITLNEEAKQALYRFIYSHAGAFAKVSWLAPSNVEVEKDMDEPAQAEIRLVPYMQARIINLPAFLKVNGYPDFPVEITDELLPQNNITIGEGIPEKMTIGEFTARVLQENKAILREYF